MHVPQHCGKEGDGHKTILLVFNRFPPLGKLLILGTNCMLDAQVRLFQQGLGIKTIVGSTVPDEWLFFSRTCLRQSMRRFVKRKRSKLAGQQIRITFRKRGVAKNFEERISIPSAYDVINPRLPSLFLDDPIHGLVQIGNILTPALEQLQLQEPSLLKGRTILTQLIDTLYPSPSQGMKRGEQSIKLCRKNLPYQSIEWLQLIAKSGVFLLQQGAIHH